MKKPSEPQVYPKLIIIRILEPPQFREKPNSFLNSFEQYIKQKEIPISKKYLIKRK